MYQIGPEMSVLEIKLNKILFLIHFSSPPKYK